MLRTQLLTLRSFLTENAGLIVAIIIAVGNGVGWLITALLNRGRPSSEVEANRARAAKDKAEADEIRMRATFDLGEEAVQVTRKLLRAQEIIFSLHRELANVREELAAEKERKRA